MTIIVLINSHLDCIYYFRKPGGTSEDAWVSQFQAGKNIFSTLSSSAWRAFIQGRVLKMAFLATASSSSSRTCKKCKCSGPNPDLTQELWGWDLTICILTSPLGVVNSHACSASRTIDLEAFLKCPSLGVHELGWGEKRVSFLFPLTSNQNTAFLSI